MSQPRHGTWTLAAALTLGACAAPSSPIGGITVDSVPPAARIKAPAAIWTALANGEARPIIIAVHPDMVPAADAARGADVALDRPVVSLDRKQRLLDDVASPDLTLEQAWGELTLLQVRATSLEGAIDLIVRDEVDQAYDVEILEHTDAESYPLINQPQALAAGMAGAGTSIAILDTGTTYTRPEFGACTAPGVPAGCKVAYAADFAPSDNALDDNGHGTNVAAIALGVAPGAQILALDVFNGAGASSTDIISAINWVVANRATYHIASMNLSLGGGQFSAPCTTDAMGLALATARAAGVAPVVASGNNAYYSALAAPACAPAAISVGAVYDGNVGGLAFTMCNDFTTAADQLTCFSNSASFLTLLAPGAMITAGGTTMAGTSQATPHVAGAMAVLRAAFPAETVDQLVARMTTTGKPLKDPRNGLTKPRLDLYAAVGAPTLDATPPTGAVVINGGAAATKLAAVTLAITGNDNVGVTQMCVSNTASCTTYEPFATAKAWTLTAGDAKKTVTVWLRDKAGNTTPVAAVIALDAAAPSGGVVIATAGNAQIALTWSGFADATSGVVRYVVVGAAGASPTSCAGAALYAGPAAAFTHTNLTNGVSYGYRVCAVDAAGNVSAGALASAAPKLETNPPVGTLAIAGGAAFTKSLTVTVALSATDDTGVASLCLGEAATCTTFVAYVTSKSYTFAAGDGPRKLSVWYRDVWGNTSAPVAAQIKIDTTAPTGGTLAATPAPSKLTLTWTAATDVGSGVTGYRLVAAAGATAPATCAAGTVIYNGPALTYTHVVTSLAIWSYRLCAYDALGNTAAGVTKTAKAQ